ncbi:MAG: type II secretion system major pseudopilin GspG [Haliea sp.]
MLSCPCRSGVARLIFSHWRGFTLIELMVVLAILGLLAGLVGPQVMKHLDASKSRAARLQVDDLVAALDLYRMENGHYPTQEQGLLALIEAPSGAENWNGPYLRKRDLPQDPWGQHYQYRVPGTAGPYDLYTLGADNQEGGEGENRDMYNWN